MPSKKTAIVILNWNGANMLRRFLPSVITYSRDEADIYVADNGSTDESLTLLRQHFPECRVIELGRNWGFAEGYNRALAAIDATYYLLLNSDVETTHHWLTPLTEFMDTHPQVAACQPKLLSATNHDSFEYAGACGGFINRYGYPFCRGRLFATVETDEGQYDNAAPVLWATGAALLVRASAYKEVGGLDGRFFAHCEEIDLCWRLRIRGYEVYCIPDSRVYHLGGGTLPQGSPMKTYLNFRNNLTMLYKCLPQEELRHVMRWRWLLDYVAAWQTLIAGRSLDTFLAIYRARHDFRRWRNDFEADRKAIQAGRKTNVIREQTRFSLLWQYYVKGRKTYAALQAQKER